MTRAALRLISPLGYAAVWIPAVALAAATLVFWCTDLDLSMVRPFFSGDPAADIAVRFPLGTQQPWKSLHDWGVYPALLLGCGGIVVWVVSFFWLKIESWRDPGLFFALVLIVGPGLLVNCAFKPFWSRPRPHALSEFKSCNNPDDPPRDFVPLFRRAFGDNDSSFPSGHAAMGFCLMIPAFVCYRRRPWLAAGFLLIGLVSGLVIGFARVVAGGHFPSDVLWAGGIVYFTALLLAVPFRFGRERTPVTAEDGEREPAELRSSV